MKRIILQMVIRLELELFIQQTPGSGFEEFPALGLL